MYVFEEMIEGKKLTEIINTTHENVKYLPGHKLPENIVSRKLFMKFTNKFPAVAPDSLEWCQKKKRVKV